jgi:hypothetical protein
MPFVVHTLDASCSAADHHVTPHCGAGLFHSRVLYQFFILEQIDAALDSLDADGGTNIWKGLLCGLDHMHQAASGDESYRKKFVFLLTDGQVRAAAFSRTMLRVTPRVRALCSFSLCA